MASLSGGSLGDRLAYCRPIVKGFCNSGRWLPPQPVEATDDAFWDQFWADTATSVQDVFALVPAAEIRAVREESPSNLATLCYKVKGAGPSLPLPAEPFPTLPGRLKLSQPCGQRGQAPRTPPAQVGVGLRLFPLLPTGWAGVCVLGGGVCDSHHLRGLPGARPH